MATIDGKGIAAQQQVFLRAKIDALKAQGIAPCLRVVCVGDNPASQLYVRNKQKAASLLGIDSAVIQLPASTAQEDLISLVQQLNADSSVHGILVQLPLPDQIDPYSIMEQIHPAKDVDGLNSFNAGRLLAGRQCIVPCTPRGIIHLIKSTGIVITGKHAVIVGRSQIVGKPLSLLLLQENATVTTCHSYTQDLANLTMQADILVVATGEAHLIKGNMVKDGAIVIDVGNSYHDGKLYGDVEFAKASLHASYITPVPGGVGPMTIAMLMRNTVEAAERQAL